MDFLRLVIMEKCEVKDIEIGQIMPMVTRVDILENYFTNGQHNIFVFQQFTSNFEHKKVASVALMLFSLLLYSSSLWFPCTCSEQRCLGCCFRAHRSSCCPRYFLCLQTLTSDHYGEGFLTSGTLDLWGKMITTSKADTLC